MTAVNRIRNTNEAKKYVFVSLFQLVFSSLLAGSDILNYLMLNIVLFMIHLFDYLNYKLLFRLYAFILSVIK